MWRRQILQQGCWHRWVQLLKKENQRWILLHEEIHSRWVKEVSVADDKVKESEGSTAIFALWG